MRIRTSLEIRLGARCIQGTSVLKRSIKVVAKAINGSRVTSDAAAVVNSDTVARRLVPNSRSTAKVFDSSRIRSTNDGAKEEAWNCSAKDVAA